MLVYVIKVKRFVKIGRTKNLASRIANMQVGSPFDYEVLMTVECGGERETAHMENLMHETFKAQRVGGEWFRFKGALRRFVNASKDGNKEKAIRALCSIKQMSPRQLKHKKSTKSWPRKGC